MSLSIQYNPAEVEEKWYSYWMEKGFFKSSPHPDKEPFTILIPPPNVTGILHMGHMLNNTIQDVLIRKARMEGKEACWVPGTDHASIATEAKVVGRLREQGIKKSDLTRDEFLEHAYKWKDEFGGIILKQLQRLGASCDWDREFFTMEEKNNKAVTQVFTSLYNKGYLYRDLKMVNWDPTAKTTVSNEEVIYKEVDAALYYVKYKIVDSDEYITIATTRPETILGDTAICIHPEDERYAHLKGKKAIVPLVNREIPIIEDEYVDIEFGTGCLKITPAHDINDYEIGQKHELETIDILNDDGTLSEAAQFYIGTDREAARKLVAKDLKDLGQLVKIENLRHKVGFSERNPDTVVEPKLSLQWFVDMQKIVTPALENVL
ncbi:MAG: class I tRNA ligase family protein, partial [Cyclobacteriaceae bacterium]|nr:class I tRNA ligase family protein [Cyclobacteriaceae bacterium]